MKAQIFLLITLYCSSMPMELRHRPLNGSRACVSCAREDNQKSDDGIVKKLLESQTSQSEDSVFKRRVFSEANQKENPTPVATLIVGSFAICCSGLFMLWGEYEKNK